MIRKSGLPVFRLDHAQTKSTHNGMTTVTLDVPKGKIVREPRRQLHKQPAFMTVDDGLTNRECFVLDVSPGGARIITDVAIDVRDKFGLALVRERPKHKPCEVVWRRGKTYGVKFLN